MKRSITSKKTAKKTYKNIVDAAIAEGLKDIVAGREIGPFETAEELIAYLHKQAKAGI